MALASEEEWENDPELRQMRKEFLESFEERAVALDGLIPQLEAGQAASPSCQLALAAAKQVAHKLAGAAESYGFPTLTLACAVYEDWCALCPPPARDPALAARGARALAELIRKTQQAGKDQPGFAQDPRIVELQALAQKLRTEAD